MDATSTIVCCGPRPSRGTIDSTYSLQCASQLVENDEKYAYSGEDRRRRFELPHLDQEALLADQGAQRVERLHPPQLVLREEVVGDRRDPQVRAHVGQSCAAEAARTKWAHTPMSRRVATIRVPGRSSTASSSTGWRDGRRE